MRGVGVRAVAMALVRVVETVEAAASAALRAASHGARQLELLFKHGGQS